MKPESSNNASVIMINLVEEFKTEHIAITDLFAQIQRLGILTREGRDCLTSCKNKLLDHLKKEDREFYPVLLKNKKILKASKSLITKYHREFEEVTQRAVNFFATYSISGGGIEFLRDFNQFKVILEDRIKREEDTLFPEILKFYKTKS